MKERRAWGYSVRKLTDKEIQKQIDDGKNSYKWFIEHPGNPVMLRNVEQYIFSERKCRISSKCQNESIYMLSYYYLTGRRGRTSRAEKPICEYHAQKYNR